MVNYNTALNISSLQEIIIIHLYLDYICRNSTNSTPVRMPGMSPTSTPSPKKRQLPAIPVDAQRASKDRGRAQYCTWKWDHQ